MLLLHVQLEKLQIMNLKYYLLVLGIAVLVSCKDSKKSEVKQEKSKFQRTKTVFKSEANREPEQDYADIGMAYAISTKAALGKNLIGTIQKDGTIAAVEFCNVAAYPITDSMAVKNNANIKRVSDKPRNLNNQANTKELAHISKFKEDISAKIEPKPIIKETNNTVQFYYPIVTNTMCLQCHGKQVNPEVYKTIKALYPKDKAIGYMENEVRGIWSISFDK